MRLLALSGQRGAALAQYETCRRALREELDVAPGAETRQLYERIRDGELLPPQRARRSDQTLGPTTLDQPAHEPPGTPHDLADRVTLPSQPTRLTAPVQGPMPLEGERRIVTVGFENDSRTEILSGLETGELIVVQGQRSLKDGQPVKLLEKMEFDSKEDRADT